MQTAMRAVGTVSRRAQSHAVSSGVSSATAARRFASSSTNSNGVQNSAEKHINLALMGAPGVGKGTFASRLAPLFSIPTISTGDLIRAEIKAGSAVGAEVKALTERGGLVSDSIVLGLLQKRLAQSDAQRGYILDGYPRRVSQAETLSSLAPVGLAVNLVLDEAILVEKALARRVCPSCGAGYNLANIVRDGYHMPPLLPKVSGQCDKCGPTAGKLVTRADDTEAIIRERLRIYADETFPIIDYYAKQGLLLEFQVRKGVADLPELASLIQKRLAIPPTQQNTPKK